MNTPLTSVAGPTRDPVRALWLAALLPAVCLGLVTIAGSFLAGSQEGASAASGAGIAILALSVAPVLHLICRNLDPAFSLGLAVMAYCLVILGMWVAYEQLGSTDWLQAPFAAWGVLLTGVGWVAGHMRGALKLRLPLYEEADRRD
jgi:hypothetical protein